jgi:hypothetical protein
VVDYHGLARRHPAALGLLMRPQLNGGTLGGRQMAIHIPIRRTREDVGLVEYHFGRDLYETDPEGPRRRRCVFTEIGRVRLDKKSGEITFVQSVSEQRELYESRVARKLIQAFSAGVFPSSIDYAA